MSITSQKNKKSHAHYFPGEIVKIKGTGPCLFMLLRPLQGAVCKAGSPKRRQLTQRMLDKAWAIHHSN